MNKEPLSYKKFRDTNITQQFYTLLLLMICRRIMFQLRGLPHVLSYIASTFLDLFLDNMENKTLFNTDIVIPMVNRSAFVNSLRIMNLRMLLNISKPTFK